MNPSELDRKVSFERNVPGAGNALNEPVENWTVLCLAWAKKMDISDSEKISAGDDVSVLRARFLVRSNVLTRSLTTDDRLVLDGTAWNVKGVKEAQNGRNAILEITAVRISDGG